MNITKGKLKKNPSIEKESFREPEVGLLQGERGEKKSSISSLIRSIGAKSRAGKNYDGRRKTNQDTYLSKTRLLDLDGYHLFGVFDGHGTNGHFASNAVKNYILSFYSNMDLYFTEMNKFKALTEQIIVEKFQNKNYQIAKDVFIKAEEELTHAKFDANFSGTTAVLTILLGNFIICSNSGDSRAIIVNDNGVSNLTRVEKTIIWR